MVGNVSRVATKSALVNATSSIFKARGPVSTAGQRERNSAQTDYRRGEGNCRESSSPIPPLHPYIYGRRFIYMVAASILDAFG